MKTKIKLTKKVETFITEKRIKTKFIKNILEVRYKGDYEIDNIWCAFYFDKVKEDFNYWANIAKEFDKIK